MLSFHEWHPDFELKASPSAAFFVAGIHVIALLAIIWVVDVDIFQNGMAFFGVTLVVLCIGLSSFLSMMRLGYLKKVNFRLFRTWQVCAVRQEEAGFWQLRLGDGSVVTCSLKGSSVVSRYITCLSFVPCNRRLVLPIQVLLTPGRVSAQDYRRLLVWLRWQGEEGLGIDKVSALRVRP